LNTAKEVRDVIGDECGREMISRLMEDLLKIGFGLDIAYLRPYFDNIFIWDELAGA
jgi:hypothetical protein